MKGFTEEQRMKLATVYAMILGYSKLQAKCRPCDVNFAVYYFLVTHISLSSGLSGMPASFQDSVKHVVLPSVVFVL